MQRSPAHETLLPGKVWAASFHHCVLLLLKIVSFPDWMQIFQVIV